jgi:hypothetical protein
LGEYVAREDKEDADRCASGDEECPYERELEDVKADVSILVTPPGWDNGCPDTHPMKYENLQSGNTSNPI